MEANELELQTFGGKPRPRILIMGFDVATDLFVRLETFGGTAHTIGSLDDVNESEWDVLITDRQYLTFDETKRPSSVAEHLYIIRLVSGDGELVELVEFLDEDREWLEFKIMSATGHFASEYTMGTKVELEGMNEEFRNLIRRDLIGTVLDRPDHRNVIFYTDAYEEYADRTEEIDTRYRPFAAASDGFAIGVRCQRSDHAETWLLPADLPDLIPWVKAAFQHWHRANPSRFPTNPDWHGDPDWATEAESSSARAVELLEEERSVALEEFGRRRLELDRVAERATELADAYERMLISGQGDLLKSAVARALCEFGFSVQDRDAAVAEKGALLEDLRLEDEAQDDWVALCEVRGTSRERRRAISVG